MIIRLQDILILFINLLLRMMGRLIIKFWEGLGRFGKGGKIGDSL
jgi:hypothetical protein